MRDESGTERQIVHKHHPNLARSQLLWKHARATERRLQHWTEPKYQKFLTDHGILTDDSLRTNEGRYRRFPALQEARRAFRKLHPWWPEFEGPNDHWRFAQDPWRSITDPARWDQHEEAVTEPN